MGNLISSQFLVPLRVTLIFNFGLSFWRFFLQLQVNLCIQIPCVLIQRCSVWRVVIYMERICVPAAAHSTSVWGDFFTLLLGPCARLV